MDPVICLNQLRVRVNDFALSVDNWVASAGECIALIGTNGSGKTTMLESMLGLRTVELLNGTILGTTFAAWSNRSDLRHMVGALLQRSAPPAGLYVSDLVFLHKQLYRESSHSIEEALGIGLLAKKRYDRLSRGEVQRVDLFMALAHQPKLVFLDEPFTGLDARYSAETARLLAARGDQTVVMSCHRLEEVQLASRITWISTGGIRADGRPEDLRQQLMRDYRMRVRLPSIDAAAEFVHEVSGISGVGIERAGGMVTVVGSEMDLEQARRLLGRRPVGALEFGQTTLSEVLVHCARKETADVAEPA